MSTATYDAIVIGAGGVEKIVAIELSSDEKAMLDKSANAVRELIEFILKAQGKWDDIKGRAGEVRNFNL